MAAKRSVAVTAILWICQILAAAAFLFIGASKLTGDPAMIRVFDAVGFGQWFRYVTGLIEVSSAVLLLVPAWSPVGAALLACTMIGAIAAHLLVLHAPLTNPLVMLVLVSIVLWLRRSQIKSLAASTT
jgi:putative oxidoreductase